MKINRKRNFFTLVELVVSLGVFSILMLISSIIFTTAQEAWTKSSRTKMIFENVRVAMNIMTSDLQSIASYNKKQKRLFKYREGNANSNDSIVFEAQTTMPYTAYTQSDNLFEIRYELFHTNNPEAENAGWIMRSCNNETQQLIPYVTELSFTPVYPPPYERRNNLVPYYLEVTLRILDINSWQKWLEIGGNPVLANETPAARTFRIKHERTFQKNILIGDRGQFH